jgi:hypothetical protein
MAQDVVPTNVVSHQETELDTSRDLGSKAVAVFGLITVFAVALLWIAAFRGWGQSNASGKLRDSDRWLQTATTRCTQTLDQVRSLRPASAESSPESRAATLGQANGFLQAQLNELERREGVGEGDRAAVDLWLADWRNYLDSRIAYTAELATGQDTQFAEPVVEGKPSSISISAFALLNGISSCASPTDL